MVTGATSTTTMSTRIDSILVDADRVRVDIATQYFLIDCCAQVSSKVISGPQNGATCQVFLCEDGFGEEQ